MNERHPDRLIGEVAAHPAPGVYRHFKGGRYLVLRVEEDRYGVDQVVYKALYGACEYYVRELTEFNEIVVLDGEQQPRFSFAGSDESDILYGSN